MQSVRQSTLYCVCLAQIHIWFLPFSNWGEARNLKLEHNCTIPPPFSLHLASSWSSPPLPATPLCHSQLLLLLPSSSPGSASHHHQLLLSFFISSPKTGSCRKAREEERRVHPVFIRSCLSLSHFCDWEFPAEYEELRIGGPLLRISSAASWWDTLTTSPIILLLPPAQCTFARQQAVSAI